MSNAGILVAQAALALVGCGYVYGATGWVCTQARLDQQAAQYPEYAEAIHKHGPQWIGKRCYDCAQLTKAAQKAASIALPSGATSQWKAAVWEEKGTMDSFPADAPGIQLFRVSQTNSAVMQHTGISCGDGTAVDARGHAYGVLHKSITGYAWTHWARPKCEEDVTMPDREILFFATVDTQTDPLSLRSTPSTESKNTIMAKAPKGSVLPVYSASGDWWEVGYGGSILWASAQYLTPVADEAQKTPEDGAAAADMQAVKNAVLALYELVKGW